MSTINDFANIIKSIAQVSTAITAISDGLGLTDRDNSVVASNGAEVVQNNATQNAQPRATGGITFNLNLIVNDKKNLPLIDAKPENNSIDLKFDI